ncbi:hypothetical protein JCM11641_007679 [Rhodosporidiobolus odoratus]
MASTSTQSDKRLYIGNLSTTVDEYLLMQVCAKHGKIAKLDYLFHKTGPQKGKPRGYAFVEYSAKEEAKRAMQALNDKVLRGRKMVISLASEQVQEERTPMGMGMKKGRAPASSEAHKPTAISLLKGGGVAKAPVNRKIAALEAKLAAMKQQRGEGTYNGSSPSGSRGGTPTGQNGGVQATLSGTAAIDPIKAGLPMRPYFQSEEAPRKM